MTTPGIEETRDGARSADSLLRGRKWEELARLGDELPDPLEPSALVAADAAAFALGQLGRHDAAIALLLRCWDVEPSYRRASSLAYLHYAALMAGRNPGRDRRDAGGARSEPSSGVPRGRVIPLRPARPPAGPPAESADRRETLRRGFRRWIREALQRLPGSIKDLYRLGIHEAQIESRHDVPALRAFLAAVSAYRRLDEAARASRPDLRKYYVRALYAGGRSALRLRKVKLARKLVFACIREDAGRHHVEPLHKFSLAAKICLAAGELDPAERAARLALDAPGPRMRDWLFGILAEVTRRRGDLPGAARWIEAHTPEHRRSSALWRQLGDVRREAADPDGAVAAYQASLQHDRAGKHLTWNRLGDIHRDAGRFKDADKAYSKALEFRRRRYLTDDPHALAGLADVLERLGKAPQAAGFRERLARATRPRGAGDGGGGRAA